jgi:hypothetical protein
MAGAQRAFSSPIAATGWSGDGIHFAPGSEPGATTLFSSTKRNFLILAEVAAFEWADIITRTGCVPLQARIASGTTQRRAGLKVTKVLDRA